MGGPLLVQVSRIEFATGGLSILLVGDEFIRPLSGSSNQNIVLVNDVVSQIDLGSN